MGSAVERKRFPVPPAAGAEAGLGSRPRRLLALLLVAILFAAGPPVAPLKDGMALASGGDFAVAQAPPGSSQALPRQPGIGIAAEGRLLHLLPAPDNERDVPGALPGTGPACCRAGMPAAPFTPHPGRITRPAHSYDAQAPPVVA